MITLRREVMVRRPPEVVFDFLADPRNEERWNPNVIRIVPLSPGTFEGTYRRGGRMRFELTEYDRPHRLVFRGGGRQMRLVATVEVAPADGGAIVEMRADMRPRGPFRLLTPALRPIAEHQYAGVAQRFRAVIEEER
jgi:uncharacterized protein YndB with AHSA1/START domain